MAFFLSEEKREYYRKKKADIARKNEARNVVKEDAVFIRYYGMAAYLELFPEAKGFGINWHRSVVDELKRLERSEIASTLSGISVAIAANLSKKSARKFKRMIKDMTKN